MKKINKRILEWVAQAGHPMCVHNVAKALSIDTSDASRRLYALYKAGKLYEAKRDICPQFSRKAHIFYAPQRSGTPLSSEAKKDPQEKRNDGSGSFRELKEALKEKKHKCCKKPITEVIINLSIRFER